MEGNIVAREKRIFLHTKTIPDVGGDERGKPLEMERLDVEMHNISYSLYKYFAFRALHTFNIMMCLCSPTLILMET